MQTSDLLNQFGTIVGAENLLTSETDRRFYGTDVYRSGELAAAVARPETTGEIQALVKLASEHDMAIFVRGGGASYTDAYTPSRPNSLIIDSGRLKSIEINETDMYVTVQPGVTWGELDDALKPKGLRAPFWGPFSGIAATIGGSVSQNSLSHGSGVYGCSAESVVSMDIVLANGDILTTGSASHQKTSSNFFRFTGPDVTALFTGDAGTLGVKASITLRLIRRRQYQGAESFSFETFDAMKDAMAEVAREGLADENFALDPALQQGQIARQDSGAIFNTAWEVFKGSSNPVSGAVTLTKMAAAGRDFLKKGAYSCHFLVDGVGQGEVRARATALREICMKYGVVIANTVPTVVRSMPFAPLFNILGPQGERWVPVHGIMPYSVASDFHKAWVELVAREQAMMDKHGITLGGMFSTMSTNAFLYEIAFYWPDERSIYHNTVLPDDHLKSIPAYDQNLEARAYMDELKNKAIALYGEFGAVHFQIGKAYPFLSTRKQEAATVLKQLKTNFDPRNVMNPGALGF